jgi:multiple sugar transport system substrate-binding protein
VTSRKLLTVAATVACLLAPAACSDSTAGPGGGGDDTVLRFQVSGEPEETAVYDALATAYTESHPDTEVEVVKVAEKSDHLARLSTSFASGNPPDAFLVNFREFSQFAARGALEPIGPHLDDEGVDRGDYYEAPLEAFTYDGELQCMPQNISSLVVYYNTGLFDELGVAEPPDQWDWQQFRRTAEQLAQGDVDGVGIEPSIIRLAPFIWSNGGTLVDDPDDPTRFTFEDPRSAEAVGFLLDLVRDGLAPDEEEVAAQDLETRFETGKLGMVLSSRVDTPRFREVRGLEWDVAPLPVADRPANILHSDAYCVSRAGDQLDEVAEFVAYAAGEQGQTLTALGGRTVPSLRSVATSPAFLDPTQQPSRARVWLDAIPQLQRTPVLPTWPEIEDLGEEALTRAYYDDVPAEDALAQLEEQTEPLFAEGRR